jgi:hypothetical protein
MNFKNAIKQEVQNAPDETNKETLSSEQNKIFNWTPIYGRPYASLYVTKEDCPSDRYISPREWLREYKEDIRYNFYILEHIVQKHFPKNNINFDEKIQKFEKFAFENSSSI